MNEISLPIFFHLFSSPSNSHFLSTCSLLCLTILLSCIILFVYQSLSYLCILFLPLLYLLVLLSVCLSLCVSQAFTYYSRWYNSLSPTYMVTSYLSLFYLSISFMSPIRFFFITHVSAYPLYPYSLSLANWADYALLMSSDMTETCLMLSPVDLSALPRFSKDLAWLISEHLPYCF